MGYTLQEADTEAEAEEAEEADPADVYRDKAFYIAQMPTTKDADAGWKLDKKDGPRIEDMSVG